MSILSNLFPSAKSAGKIVDTIAKGVDEAVYTKEEKAKNLQDWLTASLPHNVTMRFLTWSIGGLWVLTYLAIQLTGAIGQSEVSDFLLSNMKELLSPHFETVLYAYFGVSFLSRVKK